MCSKKGTLIFSRSSWGRNEIKELLDVNLMKSNMNSIDVAKAYWHQKSMSFDQLGPALDELILFSQNLSPTTNGSVVLQGLRDLWFSSLKDSLEGEEKEIAYSIVVEIGTYFKESPSIGRKQFREKVLESICNFTGKSENDN